MFRLVTLATFIAILQLGPSTAAALSSPANARTNPSLLAFALPVFAAAPAVPVASNWTFLGCWTRSTTPCSDVFRDPQGQLWICKQCGTTGNPSPGKCRRTTQAELDSGRWCS